jgi:phenylacetate-CoA ligase
VRAARPGETGEVCVTDLHNLACPMIRYVTGDLAVAREPTACRCGRSLLRIGPIEGRVTETLHDGHGNAVSGLVFNILFALISVEAKQFQIVQHVDRSIVLRLVLVDGPTLSAKADRAFREWVAKYLPGAPFSIKIVDEIPLTAAGKRKLVIVES